jgi:hypothetical protein
MKKFINALSIVFFLAPLFASASSVSWDSLSGSVGDNPTFSAIVDGGDAYVLYDLSGNSNPPNVWDGGGTYTSLSLLQALTNWGAAGSISAYNGAPGTITVAIVHPYDGSSAPVCSVLADCISGGFVLTSSTFTFTTGPSPPPPPSAIDAAIGMATTSFRQSYGFDLDQATAWMWDNLGQPILGSGIGTLVVMKWYWLGFIAFSLVIFFCFAYFKFYRH